MIERGNMTTTIYLTLYCTCWILLREFKDRSSVKTKLTEELKEFVFLEMKT